LIESISNQRNDYIKGQDYQDVYEPVEKEPGVLKDDSEDVK
jgi:hypothetical protein